MVRRLILPGTYYITQGPMELETLLGSCVAVCLKNRHNGWAAMNHFLLDRPADKNSTDIGRFGITATEHIVKKLFAEDDDCRHYCAQVFGGANVLKNQDTGISVGADNVKAALDVLGKYRIRIIHKEVGGLRGRRIKFDTLQNIVNCRFTGEIPRKRRTSGAAC